MKTKRAVSIIMAIFLIAGSIITGSALSDPTPNLYIQPSNDTAYVGDIIKASVGVDRLKSFSGYQINLKYDPSVLEPCDPDTGIPFDEHTNPKGDTVLNNENFNPISIHRYDFENGFLSFGKAYLNVESYTFVAPPESSGTLAVIGFRVKKAATTQISFADTYRIALMPMPGFNEGQTGFDFLVKEIVGYKVNNSPLINCIKAPANTPVPTNVVSPEGLLSQLTANVDKSVVKEGDIVKYTLSTNYINGFSGFQVNIKYDPSIFQPVDPYTGEAYKKKSIPKTYGELLCNEEFNPMTVSSFDFEIGLLNIGRAYMDLMAYYESGLNERAGKFLEVGFKVLKTPTESTFISLQNTDTMPDAIDGTLLLNWDNQQTRYQVKQAGGIRGYIITPTPTPTSKPTPTTQSKSKISLLLDRDFAKNGDIITAKVVVNEISQFCGYQVNIRFDPSKLKPIDLSTGKDLKDNSRIGGNELLQNSDYYPMDMQRHNIKNGILNFGRAYMGKNEYLEYGPEERSGVLAVIGFEVINQSGVNTSILFADDPSMPDALDGTYIFKGDMDVYAKDYKVIQAKPVGMLFVDPFPTPEPCLVMAVDKPGTKAGEVITAVISVENIIGFTGYQVNVKYDPLSLQPIDPNTLEPFDQKTVITGNTILNNTSYSPLSLKKYDFEEGTLNFARGYMDYILYKQNGPYESSGTLAVISFRVLKDSEKHPTLEFADTDTMPKAIQGTLLYDYNSSDSIKYYRIKEIIQKPVATPTPVVTSNNARISITADKKAAKPGDIIKATVRVDDVKDFSGYQFNLKYDPEILEPIDLATGKPLTKDSKIYGDELLRNNSYSPVTYTKHDFKAGVLNIGKAYIDLPAYRNSKQKESSGVLAIIGFKVLKGSTAPVSIVFADTGIMPDANCGTYLFNCYSDTFMTDYQVIQQARVVIKDIPTIVFKYGDVDGDGVITSTDYAWVLRYILGMIDKDGFKNSDTGEVNEYGYLAADVDGTHIEYPGSKEYLTSTDLAYIKRMLLGMIDKFPAETMK